MSGIGKIYFTVIVACSIAVTGYAQNTKSLREGNKFYEQKNYKQAVQAYQAALAKNPKSAIGLYNLGNALYQQKQTDAARKTLTEASKNATTNQEKASAQYNIGNTYMDEKNWQGAIESYKEALRKNPQDADAKYNLSYAQAMMKKDEQNNKDKNKDKKDDKDNKDDKNKDKDKEKKDQQDKQKKEGDNKDKDKNEDDKQPKPGENEQEKQGQGQPKAQPGKLSKEQADQILNALQQQEKQLQDKLQKAKGVPVKLDKDW